MYCVFLQTDLTLKPDEYVKIGGESVIKMTIPAQEANTTNFAIEGLKIGTGHILIKAIGYSDDKTIMSSDAMEKTIRINVSFGVLIIILNWQTFNYLFHSPKACK